MNQEEVDLFYSNPVNWSFFTKVITGKIVSLRAIDWLVTNYSKKNRVQYPLFDDKGDILEFFSVHESYSSEVHKHSKKMFDPFKRGKTVEYQPHPDLLKCVTTEAQKNFFFWAIKRKIVHYAAHYYSHIISDMENCKKSAVAQDAKKRRQLCPNYTIQCIEKEPVTFVFK